MLAERLTANFYDGDTFHPEANVLKMRAGVALNNDDRIPWLTAIHAWITKKLPTEPLIVACSALKEHYRKLLVADLDPSLVKWVHLQGSYDTIYKRMQARQGHFMPAAMLRSQFDTYERPEYGIFVDVDQPLDQIIDFILLEIRQ